MKRLILAFSLLLSLGFGSIAAQSLEDAEGLVSSYGRDYTMGPSSTTASVSAAGADSTPKPMEAEAQAEYKRVTVIGMSFDSDESAENFLSEMRAGIEEQAEQGTEEEDAEVQDIDFDKDGFLAVMNVPNTGVNTVVLFMDGNTVFLVDVTHSDRDTANSIATDVAEFVADAEVENEEVSYNGDGSSTGGVFDRMPTTDDEVVSEFTSMMDVEIFVSDS